MDQRRSFRFSRPGGFNTLLINVFESASSKNMLGIIWEIALVEFEMYLGPGPCIQRSANHEDITLSCCLAMHFSETSWHELQAITDNSLDPTMDKLANSQVANVCVGEVQFF